MHCLTDNRKWKMKNYARLIFLRLDKHFFQHTLENACAQGSIDGILINTSLELGIWYLGPSEWQLILSTRY